MYRFIQYFKACDIFGQSLSLGMNQQAAFYSSFGGFTSITTIFLVFLFFSTNILNYLQGKDVITKQTQIYDNELQNLSLDTQDFMIALGIQQSDFLTKPYFSIKLEQREYSKSANGTFQKNITYLPMIPCTLELFQDVFSKYQKNFTEDFKRLQLSNYLCPANNISMNIGGTFTSNNFSFLKVSISSCDSNFTANLPGSTCASEEDIAKMLSSSGNFKVQAYYINKVINPNKIDQDYISIFLDDQSYMSFVPKRLVKQQNIYFRLYQFVNNIDLYPFNEVQNLDFISIDQTESKEIVDLGGSQDSQYAAFYFRKSPITIQVVRTNQSVTDLLSKLGGLLQISLIVMGFVIAAYNKIQMLVELANKLYEFSMDSEDQSRQHEENLQIINSIYEDREFKREYFVNKEGQQQLLPSSQVKHKSNILKLFHQENAEQHIILTERPTNDNGNQENDDQSKQYTYQAMKDHSLLAQKLNCKSGLDYFKKQINVIVNRSQPLKFSLQLFCNYICFRKAFQNQLQVQFFNSAVDKINEQLDVFNILTKLNDIEKLKEILLTQSQQILFDFTSKPIITMVEEKEMPFNRTMFEERVRSTLNDSQKVKKKLVSSEKKKTYFRVNSLGADVRLYNRIYRAYDHVLQQCQDDKPQHDINKKLIKKLGDEMQAIFKLSKLLDFDGIRRLRANSNNEIRNTQDVVQEK